jgi:hypothetical protein
MALSDKYQSLLNIAHQNGVTNLQVLEENNVLYIRGTAPKQVKKQMWDEYNRIDPGMRCGDLVLSITVDWGEEP